MFLATCYWKQHECDRNYRGCISISEKVIVENNQIAVVRVNGDEATVKQIIFNDDAVILQPLSTDPSNKPLILKKKILITTMLK